jgi:NAD(P)-dependent dehydrogenase (short-subunit alcohol dehydrogenase family)
VGAETDQGGRRAAIVTGSSSGIGRATALALAETGWDVVVHGLDPEQVQEAAAEIAGAGARVATVAGQIGDPDVTHALVDTAVREFGRIDGVVNNAGAGLSKDFVDLDETDWDALVQMHLMGTVRVLRLAYPHLVATRGAAVNVSSLAARLGLSFRVGYGTVKLAVEGLTRTVSNEWAAQGVRVNGVAPGTILTPLVRNNFRIGTLDESKVLERTPMRRLGEPSEVATVIRFLLSDEASYVTGQTIAVDGGWSNWGGWS